MQKLVGLIRRCVDDYNLIESGDFEEAYSKFLEDYDGINVSYPDTANANLSSRNVNWETSGTLSIAKYTNPTLTTVKQDIDVIGEKGFTLLTSMMKNKSSQRIIINGEVIVRDSITFAKK